MPSAASLCTLHRALLTASIFHREKCAAAAADKTNPDSFSPSGKDALFLSRSSLSMLQSHRTAICSAQHLSIALEIRHGNCGVL